MFRRKLYPLLMILGIAVLGMAGQAMAIHERGTVYVSPVLAHWMAYQASNQLKDGFLWGARGGVDITSTIGLEAFGLRGLSEVDHVTDRLPAGITTINAKYSAYGLGARFNVPGFNRYAPFLSVSGGQARVEFDAPITSMDYSKASVDKVEKRNLIIVGAGAEVMITRNLALRFDLHDHYINKSFIEGELLEVRKTHNWEFGAGVTLLFGGKNEGDGTMPAPVVMPESKPEEKVIIIVSEVPEPQVEEKVKTLASEPRIEKKIIILAFEDVHFEFDKATLTEEAQVVLKRSLQILKDNPKANVRIAGYTSASGTEEYNQGLSERRSKAVEEYLINEGVVTPDRLSTIGYGETRPAEYEAAPKSLYSKAAKANMRVLFEVIVK